MNYTWGKIEKSRDVALSQPLLNRRAALGSFSTTTSSYLQCPFNKPFPRPRHTCITNADVEISYCHMESVSILVDTVKVSEGNESVESVLGRRDEDELPVYTGNGTFFVDRPIRMDGSFSREKKKTFFLEEVLRATQVVTSSSTRDCTHNIPGPVLLITRYEYCNLFHTMTDWFNTFFALPNPAANATILFLDGHAKGALDSVWPHVFGPTHFIRGFPSGSRLCLTDATFVPAGYASPLWKRRRTFPFAACPDMMNAFLHRFLSAYGLHTTKRIPGKVTIVGRKPYLAHPRSKPDAIQRVVNNLSDLAARIDGSQIVFLEEMSIRQQLQLIRETDVLIANHGAALTHLLFLHDGATVIE